MSNKKQGTPPRYEKSFKQDAIKLVLEVGLSPKEVSAELGVHDRTIKNWLKAAGYSSNIHREKAEDKRRNPMIPLTFKSISLSIFMGRTLCDDGVKLYLVKNPDCYVSQTYKQFCKGRFQTVGGGRYSHVEGLSYKIVTDSDFKIIKKAIAQ